MSWCRLQGCEESDVGIGEHLHLARLEVDLPEVGDTGVVGTAYQVFVVEREAELSQVGIFPRHQFHGLEDGLCQSFGIEHQERMLTIVTLTGHRQP